ncbi:MAG: DNA cytosine methyltransferase, partial [Burkholderiaceae bacterium]
GRVRNAFAKRGHDAWSCDLLESEEPGNHIQGDVLDVLDDDTWDLVIAHPPCTYLAVSGARWWKDRQQQQLEAIRFAKRFFDAPAKKKAIENPISKLSTAIRKPDQIVQPWMFGHGETKAACLWLFGLPHLKPTRVVEGREPVVHMMPPGKDRWKNRSRTYIGIAEAMADQWGAA